MRAMISGQAELIVMVGPEPVAYPIMGGEVINDLYLISRRLDGRSDLTIVEVSDLDEARKLGRAAREAHRAQVEKILVEEGRVTPSQPKGAIGSVSRPEPTRTPQAKIAAPADGVKQRAWTAVLKQVKELGAGARTYRVNRATIFAARATIKNRFKHRHDYTGPASGGSSKKAFAVGARRLKAPTPTQARDEILNLTDQIKALEGARKPAKYRRKRMDLERLVSYRAALLDFVKADDESAYVKLKKRIEG